LTHSVLYGTDSHVDVFKYYQSAIACQLIASATAGWQQTMDGWMDGWLGFNGILSTQVAAISCPRKFKVWTKLHHRQCWDNSSRIPNTSL